MDLRKLRMAGIFFLVAGALSFVVATREGRHTFFLFGAAFAVSGLAFLARSRRARPA